MNRPRIALITSVGCESKFLSFHHELKKIARDMFDIAIDLFKNGEFCVHLTESGEKIQYRDRPFHPQRYSLAFVRLAIRASHGGDHYILRSFENHGVPVINPPQALLARRDKLNTLQMLAQNKVPITPTVVVRTREQIPQALSILGAPPYIVKNCFGSGGQSVLLAQHSSQVHAIFDYVWHENRNEILLIQPYLGTSPASDVRAIFLNYRPWRAMVRVAQNNEFRANVKVGARTESTTLSQLEERICADAAKYSGLPLAGIDFLRTPQGPMILEVNGCPGFAGISEAYAPHGIDLLEELACFLAECVRDSEARKKINLMLVN